MNRRAFLRGAAGVAVGLPFLESLPERSAWAADDKPVFSLFICAVCGIVPESFFPGELGALTTSGLAAADKATSKLAAHADDLLFLRGINWPFVPVGESHAETLCMALTAAQPVGSGSMVQGGGPSADWVIANRVQPGTPPLTLYAGNTRNGYIAERLSFSEAGMVTAAENNPYKLYQKLMGIIPSGPTTPGGTEAERLLLESRKSVHDLVRDDLRALMANSRLSSSDKQRLQQHFDAIRDIETTMDGMGSAMAERCSAQGLELSNIEAMAQFKYDSHGMVEDLARLHMSLVALAFACNYNRVATIQWGDGTDHSIYDVPSNDRAWPLNYIMHRAQSDGQVGDDELAAKAHAEIDVVRMQTFAAGLDHFKARGLAETAQVLWTNGFAGGHSTRNLPHIIWGSGGGRLKQGQYVDVGNVANNQLLNTLITAAIQDTGQIVEDFGSGTPGLLDAVLA